MCPPPQNDVSVILFYIFSGKVLFITQAYLMFFCKYTTSWRDSLNFFGIRALLECLQMWKKKKKNAP